MQGHAPQAMGPGAYIPTPNHGAAQANGNQRNRFYAKQQSLPKQSTNPVVEALVTQQQYYSAYNSQGDREEPTSPEQPSQQTILNGQISAA